MPYSVPPSVEYLVLIRLSFSWSKATDAMRWCSCSQYSSATIAASACSLHDSALTACYGSLKLVGRRLPNSLHGLPRWCKGSCSGGQIRASGVKRRGPTGKEKNGEVRYREGLTRALMSLAMERSGYGNRAWNNGGGAANRLATTI